MSLEDLNRKLYSNQFDPQKRITEVEEESGKQTEEATVSASPFIQEEKWSLEKEEQRRKKIRKIVIISAISIVFVALAIGGAIYFTNWRKDAFLEDRVTLTIDGLKNVDSGQAVEYKIKVKNDNRVSLKDAEVVIDYTENFQPNETDNVNLKQVTTSRSRIHIGEIKPKEEKQLSLKGAFYAPKDFPAYLRGTLTFSPENLSMKLESTANFGVNITTSPIYLEIVAPGESLDGDTVEYVIDFQNQDIRPMRDLQLKMQYPAGFEYVFSDLKPSEGDNLWYLGMLDREQAGKIRIRGKLQGVKGEAKQVVVEIGKTGDNGQFVAYNRREQSTRINIPLVAIDQTVENLQNQSISSGEMMRYLIKVKNNSDRPLTNLSVQTQLRSKVLDLGSMRITNGSYDASLGNIIWKASDVPNLQNLAPAQEVALRFEVPVLKMIPVKTAEDKNFTVRTATTVSSTEIINPSGGSNRVTGSELEVRLNSKVLLSEKAFYNDGKIPNNGPVPPKVGSETTYTVHWNVSNISNEAKDMKLVSSLPSGVRWIGKVSPSGENIKFDSSTNQITWDIGVMGFGVGVLSPEKEVAFQIGITPQSHQVGQSLKLINPTTLTGTDTFTGNQIKLETQGKDMTLSEDLKLSFDSYRVVP